MYLSTKYVEIEDMDDYLWGGSSSTKSKQRAKVEIVGFVLYSGLTELVIRLDKDQDWANGILINVPGLF